MNEFNQALEPESVAIDTSWTKSSLSHVSGNCVEIANLPDGQIGMRNSRNVGPVLGISPAEFKALLGGTLNGEFDFRSE